MTAEMATVGVAPVVAQAVREVYEQCAGSDLPGNVLAAAKDPESVLHPLFQWDDTQAAEQYRRDQASALVRRVQIKVIRPDATEPTKVRAYVARRDLGPAAQGGGPGDYLALEAVAGATEREVSVLDAIRADLVRLEHKYAAHRDYFQEALGDVLAG